jgi:decaprenylphospho-beta-D-ribofuranose 2-oxidase
MGRAYGDAAQRRDGLVLDTRGLRGFELDPVTGTVTAQAGVTLGELLAHCVPAGWMVPVVPGTQHVSVGGAVASDIHGKNHGTASTFGRHVQALGLFTSEADLLELTPGDPAFEATLGGMGLTGIIVWARIALRPVSGALLSVDLDRVVGLDAALAALQAPGGSYRVCWLDLLARRPRGVVTRAEHLDWSGPAGAATVAGRATVPARWPSGLLHAATVRAFNELRFRSMPARARGRIESIGAHMFPLDALDAWPRLYGRPGFRQYQIVVPPDRSDVLETVIERLRRAHVPCFLAVLKDFGPANGAPLSFPIAGWTLTLDLPRAAPNLDATLDECDPIVAEAGGRVYFAKDDRARPEVVRAMYPRLAEWQDVRERLDPKRLWASDLALRAGLIA